MKKVAIVTGPVKNCGIHVYGTTLYDILKKSEKYEFCIIEASSREDIRKLMRDTNVHALVYNWHNATMPWLTKEFISQLNINQFMIVGHELHADTVNFSNIKAKITIDPTLPQTEGWYPGVRPIVYYSDIRYSQPNKVLKIGTSGFGERKKGFDRIVEMINSQFVDEEVELNVHFSVGHYVDSSGKTARDAIQSQYKLNSNIKLNVTHEFFTNIDLVKWLNNNDINLYCYDNYDGPGVSASIDKALAAKKPIGVNTSNYFKHVRKDEIDITKTPIKEIVKLGTSPLEEFYDKWNENKLIEQYETILQKYEV